jgi:hypothetical protein
MKEVQEILGDFRDGNIIDVQFVPFDEKKQQVEWSLKLWKLNLVRWCLHDLAGLNVKFRRDAGTLQK